MDTSTTPSTVRWSEYPVPVLELVVQIIDSWIAGDVIGDESELLSEGGRIKIAKRLQLAHMRNNVKTVIDRRKNNGTV